MTKIKDRFGVQELIERLKENGNIGLDLSPGNKTELQAYDLILELIAELDLYQT